MHSFEGLWQPIQAEHSGEPAPKIMLEKMEVELANGTYVVRFGGVAADHGTYEIDGAGLTLKGVSGPNAGKTIPCLFQFVGGRLMICYGLGGVRPETFGTATGAPFYLATYARKPAG
jgi:uncharacterized protein (TIGR03067 family)